MSQIGRAFPAVTETPSEMSYRSRRRFLEGGISLWIVAGVSATARSAAAVAAGIPVGGDKGQDQWRGCNKCSGLFYDGYAGKGRCPAGGGHVAQGFIFILPFNTPAERDTQAAWRFCNKCSGMFYDGYPGKGRCPVGDGHVGQGLNFVLHHDTAASKTAQPDWRFCNKCNGMFYDGYPQKGRCPTGGGHVAQGYNFVLSHPDGSSGKAVINGDPSPKVKYCTDISCSACKRDGLQCGLSIQCDKPNAQYACY